MSIIEFEKIAKTTRATLNKLEALGCVKIADEEIYRNPLDNLGVKKKEALVSTFWRAEKSL